MCSISVLMGILTMSIGMRRSSPFLLLFFPSLHPSFPLSFPLRYCVPVIRVSRSSSWFCDIAQGLFTWHYCVCVCVCVCVVVWVGWGGGRVWVCVGLRGCGRE